jgi:SAM-dependent methyltransferase
VGEDLLDVGCGEGLLAFGALERGAGTVTFCDISSDLLAFCRQAAEGLCVLERARFVEASADDLAGIADASVDVVTTRSVLIYVADKRAAFEEFARVLRRLLEVVAVSVLIAGVAVPGAQAGVAGKGYSPVDRSQYHLGEYGFLENQAVRQGLDPWAHIAVERSKGVDLGPLDPWAYAAVHRSKAAGNGPLDGWAYGVIKAHTSSPIGTLHSAHPPNPVEARGFRWRDAGIGAAFTLFCILLAGVATYTLRRRRALAHV